ncbi:MAG: flagellar biosynthesis anti-sigma factor FlgM [Syntrophaceae bacterium]|nr:flagellar biosynthesis anti-sigma factor FlgM [Syntrophaceae bacterium]
MKINDTNSQTAQVISSYARGETTRPNPEKSAEGTVPVPQERIDLSGKAKEVLQLQKAVTEAPEVREDRVNELKARIESGNYNVSAGDIASKIVGDTLTDLIR